MVIGGRKRFEQCGTASARSPCTLATLLQYESTERVRGSVTRISRRPQSVVFGDGYLENKVRIPEESGSLERTSFRIAEAARVDCRSRRTTKIHWLSILFLEREPEPLSSKFRFARNPFDRIGTTITPPLNIGSIVRSTTGRTRISMLFARFSRCISSRIDDSSLLAVLGK